MTLIEQLKRDEGSVHVTGPQNGLIDYLDSKKLWTRGYGHLLTPQPSTVVAYQPQVISEAEATALLVDDLNKHDADLFRMWPEVLRHNQYAVDAVRNMNFNLGTTRLLGFKGFVRAMNVGNYIVAVIEMLDSKWHREDVGPRAVRLAKQIATRTYQ
jgi:lysozyme